MEFTNIAFIYQPHFLTKCLRPAVKNCLGDENFIIVTCSPEYNGVYRVTKEVVQNCNIIKNGKLDIYEVPISECEYLGELEDLKLNLIAEVMRQQNEWYKSQVKNNKKVYPNGKPDWMLK